ncbi:unnamed protein product [Protopolystoma xenopodis]|uniref:Uncharacterized protein n=1 Tax=Protopolystoma xenopodis TaxID=117903 RepID=A0A3S5CMS5_9PLAT|nr:unnamed protein product [Protopolystoma xenopodis]
MPKTTILPGHIVRWPHQSSSRHLGLASPIEGDSDKRSSSQALRPVHRIQLDQLHAYATYEIDVRAIYRPAQHKLTSSGSPRQAGYEPVLGMSAKIECRTTWDRKCIHAL